MTELEAVHDSRAAQGEHWWAAFAIVLGALLVTALAARGGGDVGNDELTVRFGANAELQIYGLSSEVALEAAADAINTEGGIKVTDGDGAVV